MEALASNKKYTAILLASRELFWKHGVRRVTIDEICRKSQTSKMTFYRFFSNKTELAKAVIDRYYEESIVNFRKITRSGSSAAEKFQMMIRMKVEGSNDISNEFIQDLLSINNPELASFFEEKLKAIWAEGISEFKFGQQEGWIRKDLNVEFMFFFFQKTTSFLADPELMAKFSSPQEMVVEMSNLIIYGVAPRT